MAERATADSFRSDINGLRAISVALVIGYHLADGAAPGGFIGVDVFLVISGFLMTRIIVGDLQGGRFSVWRFYLARLRRIWPALIALCLALWVVGATLLDPWTFERIGADIPAAVAFVSNIVFASRRGYFAPDETPNWLLHTWSLSLEWQFYLLYPLLLIAVWATPVLRRRLWPILGLLAAASFALALRASIGGARDAYFLLPTRVWELLAGALCAAAPGLRLGAAMRAALHLGGLALIAAGVAIAVPADGWPTPVALLPVGGAALLILAGLRRTLWAENPAVAAVGRASYSIYLWHWPIVIALREAAVPMTALTLVAAVMVMLALGVASYWLVEQAATRWLFDGGRRRPAFALAAAATVAALGAAAGTTHGLEGLRTAHASPAQRAEMTDLRAASADWSYPQACTHVLRRGGISLCQIGDPSARRVLVVGDSQAEQLAARYRGSFDGPGEGVTFLAAGGCLPIPGVDIRYRHGCARWAEEAFRFAETGGFRRVVIISAWPLYFEPRPGMSRPGACLDEPAGCAGDDGPRSALVAAAFDRLGAEVGRLRARGIDVALMQATPAGLGADPRWIYRRLLETHNLAPPPLLRTAIERDTAVERDGLADVAARSGASLVDPLDALCPAGLCPVVEDGGALFKDRWHYRAGALTGPRFAYLDPWLSPAAPPTRLK